MAKTTQPASEPSARLFILVILLGLFVLWTLVGTLDNVPSGPIEQPPGFYNLDALRHFVLFTVNLWALLAGLVVGLMAFNPFHWRNGKRLAFGGMALAVMLGRLVGGLFAEVPLLRFMPEPMQFLLMPFVLLASGVMMILTLASLLFLLFAFFVGVPILLCSAILQFEQNLARYRYYADGLAGYIVRFMFWLRNQPLPEAPPDESRGARFATSEEIRALYRPGAESMAFGHLGAPLFLKTDKHILIMASTRSGKGISLIIPHLLRYQGSVFCLDPKGENARATGRRRGELNDKVHYLDPFGISGKPRSRFNPLSRFTPANMEAESRALAAALFMVEGRKRDHWTDAGQQLLAACILYVHCSPRFAAKNKDLPAVRRVLLGDLQASLRDMMAMEEADGLLADLGYSFVNTPAQEFGSIASTAQRQTEILDNPAMIACLSASGPEPEVDFSEWRRGTMSVFLCLAAPKFPTFSRWLRLVLTSALDDMTETLDPPKLPVCFMLDELATLGHLQSVENAVGLAAGYGIQLVCVFQDVAQMRGIYQGRWASFIGNAGVRAVFNLDDLDTATYWSKFLGNRLVESYSHKEDIYGLSDGQDVKQEMRPLLSPDRMMMDFASDKMLVLAQGAHPIVTERVGYFKDRSLAETWDDPRGPVTNAQAAGAGGPWTTSPLGGASAAGRGGA